MRRTRIGSMFVGVVLVAFVTSAPELVTQITQGSQGHAQIALSNTLGANCLTTLALAGVFLFFLPKNHFVPDELHQRG